MSTKDQFGLCSHWGKGRNSTNKYIHRDICRDVCIDTFCRDVFIDTLHWNGRRDSLSIDICGDTLQKCTCREMCRCWNSNNNTLDFLWTSSRQKARRLFVWITFHNHLTDLKMQERYGSWELNTFKESLRVSFHSMLITLVKSNNYNYYYNSWNFSVCFHSST